MKTINALSAVAAAAFIAAAITILPGFAPVVEAGEPHAMAKSDKIAIEKPNCAMQSWPNFDVECLRRLGAGPAVQPVRIVVAARPEQ